MSKSTYFKEIKEYDCYKNRSKLSLKENLKDLFKKLKFKDIDEVDEDLLNEFELIVNQSNFESLYLSSQYSLNSITNLKTKEIFNDIITGGSILLDEKYTYEYLPDFMICWINELDNNESLKNAIIEVFNINFNINNTDSIRIEYQEGYSLHILEDKTIMPFYFYDIFAKNKNGDINFLKNRLPLNTKDFDIDFDSANEFLEYILSNKEHL